MKILVFIILVLCGFGFGYGILKATNLSLAGTPDKMPIFLVQIVTVIGGILATNLGFVIGISITQSSYTAFILQDLDTPSLLQMIAAYIYFIGLIIGMIGWARVNFSEDRNKVVMLLPRLGQTLLGVAAGILAMYLGVDG